MNTKLLKILERNQDCYIYFVDSNHFVIYKEKPKAPMSEDYLNVITLYEGTLEDRESFAPNLVIELARCIGIDVESKGEEYVSDESSE